MSKQELTPQSQIQGLTAEQVDWSLFGEPYIKDRIINGLTFDFRREVTEARDKFIRGEEDRGFIEVRIAPDLKAFLEQNRPQTLFFQPQDISSLLTSNSDIVVDYNKENQLATWKFRLNPEKHIPSEGDRTYGPETITLTRGKKDAGKLQPYLIVDFRTSRYDDSRVIFSPEIGITYEDRLLRNTLDREMIKLLGLREHSVSQNLNFAVRKAEIEWFKQTVEISLAPDIQTVSPR